MSRIRRVHGSPGAGRAAGATPATAEMLRLMDATPVSRGQLVVTARRSDLYGYAGYGNPDQRSSGFLASCA
jgi:hypothetical protein